MVAETFPHSRTALRCGGRTRVAALLGALAAAVAGGCGGNARPADEQPIHGTRLAIYAAAPLHGPDRQAGEAILRAQRLALQQDGGRIGRYRVRLVTLDAARPFTGGSDPAKVSLNARRAAHDPHAVAYLGEVRTGASAVSIPILNEAGMLEVSPLDTALGLTTRSAEVTGSPERYYPNAKRAGRTFARLVPSDRAQAAALLDYMADEGVRRVALLTDEDVSGVALASVVQATAREHGISVAVDEQVDAHQQEHPDLVAEITARRPDTVLYAGGTHEVARRILRELTAADPGLRLFVSSMLADSAFAATSTAAGISAYATRPLLALRRYPPAARRFARTFAARYGAAPAPEALYGYEAMRSVLAAIRQAEHDATDGLVSRSAVVDAFFDEGRRDGVLGRYAIDAHGDSTLDVWGAFRLAGGRVTFEHTLDG